MTKYVVEESGDFRRGEEGVFNGEQCIFMAPPARFVPQLMEDLFGWMKEEKESVHLFSDGNVTQRHQQKVA